MNPAIVINVSTGAAEERAEAASGSRPTPVALEQLSLKDPAPSTSGGKAAGRPVPTEEALSAAGRPDAAGAGAPPEPVPLDQLEAAAAGRGTLPTPGGVEAPTVGTPRETPPEPADLDALQEQGGAPSPENRGK